MIAVPRSKNGFLLDFGSVENNEKIKNQLRTIKTKGYMKLTGRKNKQISHLNGLIDQFKTIYPQIWNKTGQGYICIDESVVDWNRNKKLLPVGIKYPDYIKYKKSRSQEITEESS